MKLGTSSVFVVIVAAAILMMILFFQFGIFNYLAKGISNFLSVSNTTITKSANQITNAISGS